MNFVRAWVLLFALIPAGWLAYEWRRTTRKLAIGLKAASLILVIVALSEPRLNFNDTKVAVAALVDTSASVSPQDLTGASDLVNPHGKEARLQCLAGNSVRQGNPQCLAFRNGQWLEIQPYLR